MILFILAIIPLLVIALGLSISPLPLRVDAANPAERRAQHCLRVSFFLIAIPAAVMLIRLFFGEPGFLAYRGLSYGSTLWKSSSIAGMLCGIAAALHPKRRNAGYRLFATHAMLLFLVVLGSELP